MGLDNGFITHGIKQSDVPYWVKPPWDDVKDDDFEIVYFRKYWGVRNEILRVLHQKEDNDSQTNVDSEDIIPIVKILMKYLNKEYYEDSADSIWEYDEAYNHIVQSIINLMWLKMYMEQHTEVKCYFYDSW